VRNKRAGRVKRRLRATFETSAHLKRRHCNQVWPHFFFISHLHLHVLPLTLFPCRIQCQPWPWPGRAWKPSNQSHSWPFAARYAFCLCTNASDSIRSLDAKLQRDQEAGRKRNETRIANQSLREGAGELATPGRVTQPQSSSAAPRSTPAFHLPPLQTPGIPRTAFPPTPSKTPNPIVQSRPPLQLLEQNGPVHYPDLSQASTTTPRPSAPSSSPLTHSATSSPFTQQPSRAPFQLINQTTAPTYPNYSTGSTTTSRPSAPSSSPFTQSAMSSPLTSMPGPSVPSSSPLAQPTDAQNSIQWFMSLSTEEQAQYLHHHRAFYALLGYVSCLIIITESTNAFVARGKAPSVFFVLH
jgi:hypothetical protein